MALKGGALEKEENDHLLALIDYINFKSFIVKKSGTMKGVGKITPDHKKTFQNKFCHIIKLT